jgi:hypothetical protein
MFSTVVIFSVVSFVVVYNGFSPLLRIFMIINFDFLTTKLSPNNENQILNFKSKECIACNAPEIIMGLDKTFFYLEMLLH